MTSSSDPTFLEREKEADWPGALGKRPRSRRQLLRGAFFDALVFSKILLVGYGRGYGQGLWGLLVLSRIAPPHMLSGARDWAPCAGLINV